jgi:DNA repair exonuclease SbcCD ATPase subunit
MEHEQQLADRLEQAAGLLERALARIEERSGEVERISATIEQSRREEELADKLAAAEREIAELRAATSTLAPQAQPAAPHVLTSIRKTVPASTTAMLAKHGIGDGPVDARTLDAALSGLSLEQRIAVKSQLLRAGALS